MKNSKLVIRILISLLLLSLFVYIYHIYGLSANYLPIWSDEFLYYMNSFAFYKTNSISAAITYNGEGSVIFNSDAHGFMYTLTHGLIAQVFGWSNFNLVYTNLSFIGIAAGLFYFVKDLSLENKLIASILVISYPFSIYYGLTFMQEMFQVLFGVSAGLFLYKSFTAQKSRPYIILYVLTIILAGLYRPTWLFWLIGLIPHAKSKKQVVLYSTLFITSVGLSFVYAQYFFEPVPNFFNKTIALLKTEGIVPFIKEMSVHFAKNVVYYLAPNKITYYLLKMSILSILGIFSYLYWVKREKVYLSIVFIFGVNIIFLLVCYDAFLWREIRFLSPLFYFSIIFIVQYVQPKLKYIGTAIVFLSFIGVQNSLFTKNRDKNTIKDIETNRIQLQDAISRLPQSNAPLGKLDYAPANYSIDILSLPVETHSNIPIRYIVPYYPTSKKDVQFTIKKKANKLLVYPNANE